MPMMDAGGTLGDYDLGNPTNQLTDAVHPFRDKPFATEKVRLDTDDLEAIWRKIEAGFVHKKRKFDPTYEKAKALWEGDHWPEDEGHTPYDGYLTANLIPGFVKTLVESVAFSTPDFTLTPWSRLGETNLETAKSVLKYAWREANAQEELKRATYDSKMYGTGIIQIGWLFRTQETTMHEGRLPVQPAPGAVYTPAQEADSAPSGSLRQPVPADEVIDDRFEVRRISPNNFVVPPEANSMVSDWPWCVKIERLPLAQVKRDPRFKNTAALKGTTELTEPYLADDLRKLAEEDRPSDVRYVELLHFYERDRRLHLVLCRENRLKPLLVEKWSWETRRYPFRTITNTHLPDDFYGKSIAVELLSQQIDINECDTQVMEHRRQFNRLYQCPEGVLDNKAEGVVYEGKPGSIAYYRPGTLDNPIRPIDHPQLQPEVYKSRDISMQTMEQISGLSQFQMHNPPSKRLSANESQAIQQAGGALFLADAQAFVKLCEEVGEDALDWMQQYAEVAREIPLRDGDGKVTSWIHFTGDQIRGDWLLTVDINSTQPPNAQSQLQDSQLALQTLVQAAQFTNPQTGELPRPMAIVMRQILTIIGVRDVDQLLPLPPLPPPLPPQAMPPPGMPGQPGPAQGMPPGAPPGPPAPPQGPAGGQGGPPITAEQMNQWVQNLPPQLLAALLAGQ